MFSTWGGEDTNYTLHPQSDGMVKRFNRAIEAQLSKFVDAHHRDWDRYVPLLLVYRTSVHESTQCTPAMMMMGRLKIDLLIGRHEEEPSTNLCDHN